MRWWRRRRNRSGSAVTARLETAERDSAADRTVAAGPSNVRPPLVLPPGESRYHRSGGLRSRLDALDESDEDLHVTVDLTELRSRTRR